MKRYEEEQFETNSTPYIYKTYYTSYNGTPTFTGSLSSGPFKISNSVTGNSKDGISGSERQYTISHVSGQLSVYMSSTLPILPSPSYRSDGSYYSYYLSAYTWKYGGIRKYAYVYGTTYFNNSPKYQSVFLPYGFKRSVGSTMGWKLSFVLEDKNKSRIQSFTETGGGGATQDSGPARAITMDINNDVDLTTIEYIDCSSSKVTQPSTNTLYWCDAYYIKAGPLTGPFFGCANYNSIVQSIIYKSDAFTSLNFKSYSGAFNYISSDRQVAYKSSISITDIQVKVTESNGNKWVLSCIMFT